MDMLWRYYWNIQVLDKLWLYDNFYPGISGKSMVISLLCLEGERQLHVTEVANDFRLIYGSKLIDGRVISLLGCSGREANVPSNHFTV